MLQPWAAGELTLFERIIIYSPLPGLQGFASQRHKVFTISIVRVFNHLSGMQQFMRNLTIVADNKEATTGLRNYHNETLAASKRKRSTKFHDAAHSGRNQNK